MFDTKKVFYSSYFKILEVYNSPILIIFDYLTTHNLYKINHEKTTNPILISDLTLKTKNSILKPICLYNIDVLLI